MPRPPTPTPAASLLAIALPLLLVACDRRKVEDDSTATPADTELAQEGEIGSAPGPGPDAPIEPDVTPMAPEPPDPSETAAPAAGATSQADALALLVAVNEHEIAAADQALTKDVAGPVRAYAQTMKAEHARNLADTTRLGAAASTSPAVASLRSQGENDLRTLAAHSGKEYERAYVDAMVSGHTEALALIDHTLLPAATDPNVRQHLTATRAAVAHHLDEAKKLQVAP